MELIKHIIEYYKGMNSEIERLQVHKWLKEAIFDREEEPLVAYLHSAIREMFENEAIILIDYVNYDNISKVFFKRGGSNRY